MTTLPLPLILKCDCWKYFRNVCITYLFSVFLFNLTYNLLLTNLTNNRLWKIIFQLSMLFFFFSNCVSKIKQVYLSFAVQNMASINPTVALRMWKCLGDMMVGISYLSTTLPSFTTHFNWDENIGYNYRGYYMYSHVEKQNFSSSVEKYFTSELSEFMSDIFFTHVCWIQANSPRETQFWQSCWNAKSQMLPAHAWNIECWLQREVTMRWCLKRCSTIKSS